MSSATEPDRLDLVVSDVFAHVDACLPARFPTWTDDAATLIAARRQALTQQLEHVKGCAELAITATWTTPLDEIDEPQGLTPGTRYLRGRQRVFEGSYRQRQRANVLMSELTDMAKPSVRDTNARLCPSNTVALSLALLVERATAESVKARLPRTCPDVRILVYGPWPPYTFAGVFQHSGQGDG